MWILQSMLWGQVPEGWTRIEIARDTWLSNHPSEQNTSNGGAPKLKLKSIIELSIIDFQPTLLKGKTIEQAKLMLKLQGDRPIERVSLGTLSADWIEGTGNGYQVIEGVSTFTHRIYPSERWYDSDVTAVSIGQGNTIYASVDAKPSAEKGWVELEIPTEILLARTHGLSYGILLMDDTGSTWTRNGDEFKQEIFPNRFVASKDSNKSSAPYILVKFSDADNEELETSPKPVDSLVYRPPDQKDPRDRLTWEVPPEQPSRLIGFRAKLDGQLIEPFWVPSIQSGLNQSFTMPLDRLLTPQAGLIASGSTEATVTVQAIGRNGLLSQEVHVQVPIRPIDTQALPLQPIAAANHQAAGQPIWDPSLQKAGNHWSVIDPLDVYIPANGTLIPAQRPTYLTENHLFDSRNSSIKLQMARGAWAGLQLVSKKPASPKLSWTWNQSNPSTPAWKDSRIEFYSYRTVPSGDQAIPDPLVPMTTQNLFPSFKADPGDPKQGSNWLIEAYLPPEVPSGLYNATLEIEQDGQKAQFGIEIHVHDVVIPKTLSFLPEMNCYGLPDNDIDYYRLGHRHRTVLNRVPYSQSGKLAEGCAPEWNQGEMDWSAFDRRFGGLFSGEAFKDLPRGNVPIECFYLAMHENWPLPIDPNYNGSYWADQAFTKEYRQAWVSSVAQSFDHLAKRKWNETRFHVYLNNKNNFKAKGWSRGSSPWLLDEPANFQDYIALKYFGRAYLDGLRESQAAKKLAGDIGIQRVDGQELPQVVFRADISRPQWQRDTLDEMLQFNVVAGGAFKQYQSLVLDRKFRFGHEVIVYGSNNPIGRNNATAVAWSWDAWSSGADGVLPWQTIGNSGSWEKADELALFYPSQDPKTPGPVPSIRLKAYCYGQQDVEILEHLARKSGLNRYRFGQKLRKSLTLQSRDIAQGDYAEPASWSDYGSLTPEMLHHWRVQLLELGK